MVLKNAMDPWWWYRYVIHVDNSHVCIAHKHLTEFHSHRNSINQHIKFTVEEEKDGSIAFLDTMTTRNPNGTIKSSVYRKATHTEKYLLNSALTILLNTNAQQLEPFSTEQRASLPLTQTNYRKYNVQHYDALKINGHTG